LSKISQNYKRKQKKIVKFVKSIKYRFKNNWIVKPKEEKEEDDKIIVKSKRLDRINVHIHKLEKKQLKYKAKWINYMGFRRRKHSEKIKKAQSKSLKRYLKRHYASYTKFFKLRVKRSLKRVNRRITRVVSQKKSYIRRYKRIFRRKRYFKRKIEKYTNLLKHRLSARERVFYNKLLADAQKDQHKYLESMRIRKILRNRRACIRSYARTTRRFNNYRRRTLRIIKKNK